MIIRPNIEITTLLLHIVRLSSKFSWSVVYYRAIWCSFLAQAQKIKKLRPKKFLYFGKWNVLALIIRSFLYFLKRKLFLYFGRRKPRKNSLYFRKRNFLIIQETETLKNFLYFTRELLEPEK